MAQPKGLGVLVQDGVSAAVKKRGLSFIKAANLMLEHSDLLDLENRDYLENLEHYWNNLNTDLKSEDLGVLEKTIMDHLNERLYGGEKALEKIKEELDDAENHINRKHHDPLIAKKEIQDNYKGNGLPPGKKIDVTRSETAITHFGPELEQEYQNILKSSDSERPTWFKKLPAWEQKYFTKLVEDFNNQKNKDNAIKNLGDFLGTLPTTIRKYPGATNAYVTKVEIESSGNTLLSFIKVRSGVIVPSKMKDKKEKIKNATLNLEQLIMAALKAKIEQSGGKIDANSIPILFQTLYSPPKDPPGKGDNDAVEKALKAIRSQLSSKEGIQQLCGKYDITPQQIGDLQKIDVLFSSRPVNRLRGASSLLSINRRIENSNTLSSLKGYVNSLDNKDPNKAMAQQALEKIKILSQGRAINGVYALTGKNKHNYSAEQAALEQLIANLAGGVRVGSCVSGKDREEMVTAMAIAQAAFFKKYGMLPPAPNEGQYTTKAPNGHNGQAPTLDKNIDNYKLREEFDTMVAHEYLSAHGQELAARNSDGCYGLKNVKDVLGGNICDKIKTLAPEYGIDLHAFHPIKDNNAIAKLNKLDISEVDVNTATFKENVHNNNFIFLAQKNQVSEEDARKLSDTASELSTASSNDAKDTKNPVAENNNPVLPSKHGKNQSLATPTPTNHALVIEELKTKFKPS